MDVREVYLNGVFVPAGEAGISIFDRGFIFGDGVYEVIPAYGGRLFRLSQHLQRLHYSLDAIGITAPHSDAELETVFQRLLDGVPGDASIYLQITRGVAPRNHAFPENLAPTVLAYAQAVRYPDRQQREAGVTAITLPDQRWARCDIKSVSLLANVLARQQAHERGAVEAILLRDGYLTEGAASTVFLVSDGCLMTPPKGHAILPGITRDLVVELAAEEGIPLQQCEITEAMLRSASEVWVASSTKEILPVIRLDDHVIGDGAPGPAYRRMVTLYDLFKERFRRGEAS